MNQPHAPATPPVVRVCMGGTVVKEFPLQAHATHDTLRNIYDGHRQLPQSDLDSYNRLTDEINKATYHTTREFLLDQRHRGFVAAMLAQRDGRQSTIPKRPPDERLM